jgi:integrase
LPATVELVITMLSHFPQTLAGERDRAILALGFSGAFRRSELAALDVSDLRVEKDGIRVQIRRSKTDQEGKGQEVAIRDGRQLRPVEAVAEWLQAAQIGDGRVFRPVSRSGKVRGEVRLTDRSIAEIVKRYAGQIGLKVDEFAARSLRAGLSPRRPTEMLN